MFMQKHLEIRYIEIKTKAEKFGSVVEPFPFSPLKREIIRHIYIHALTHKSL